MGNGASIKLCRFLKFGWCTQTLHDKCQCFLGKDFNRWHKRELSMTTNSGKGWQRVVGDPTQIWMGALLRICMSGVDYSAYFLAFFPIQILRQGQPSPSTSGQVEQHVSQPTSTLKKRKCIHETQLAQKGAFCSVLLDIWLRWVDGEGFKFRKVGDGSCT